MHTKVPVGAYFGSEESARVPCLQYPTSLFYVYSVYLTVKIPVILLSIIPIFDRLIRLNLNHENLNIQIGSIQYATITLNTFNRIRNSFLLAKKDEKYSTNFPVSAGNCVLVIEKCIIRSISSIVLTFDPCSCFILTCMLKLYSIRNHHKHDTDGTAIP